LKKPLIPENRKDIGKSNDDLLNAQKSKPNAPVAEAPKALKTTIVPVKATATKVESKKAPAKSNLL